MPFTFAHPAIVLPLIKLGPKWVSITGLVVGSIVPDFEYFLRMQVKSEFSHTIGGIFWFDLPLAIIIAIVFHLQVKDSLLQNLPIFLRKRLIEFSKNNWPDYLVSNWTVVIVSNLIGSFSHIIWDSFTHIHGFFVEGIPVLRNEIVILSTPIPYFKIFQHFSSIIGVLFIIYFVLSLPATSIETGHFSYSYWFVFISLTFLIIGFRSLGGPLLKQVGHLIVTIIAAALFSLILTPFLTKNWHNGR